MEVRKISFLKFHLWLTCHLDYVIQTALNQVEGNQRELLYARVRSHLMSIKREPRPKIEPKHIVASRLLN